MAESPASLKKQFDKESAGNIISLNDLAGILGLNTAFQKLVEAHIPADIVVKSQIDPVFRQTDQEDLRFVPEIYHHKEGMPLPCKDFWLQVHIKGIKDNPVMGLKFMDMGDGTFDMCMPYLTSIMDGDIYYRPVLGHHVIENVVTLVHRAIGKPLKNEPPSLLAPPPVP